ncbi:hypothetical protein ACFL39_01530 [Gemmatimonadota bacterium]
MTQPDFSGRWKFDPEASILQIDIPDFADFQIEHLDSKFRLERTIEFAGRSDTFAITLEIDAENPPFFRHQSKMHPSLHWEGDQLVFRTVIITENEEATNLVRYWLESNGSVLVASENFESPSLKYQNRWVLTKQ